MCLFYYPDTTRFKQNFMISTYVEVFKTNVAHAKEANRLLEILRAHFPECSFNFDLDDCDKILRAKGMRVMHDKTGLMKLVAATGHLIEILPD